MPRFKEPGNRKTEANRLFQLRDALGLAQRELADEFRVAHGAIGQWESGTRTIPGPVLKLMELYEEELKLNDPVETDLPPGKEMPASFTTRGLKISKTSTSVTALWAASCVEQLMRDRVWSGTIQARTQLAIARQIVDTLGEMKGFAMKAGQMMSYLDFVMPEPVRRIYASLETTAAPMPAGMLARVFHEEFGKSPKALFAEWSERPFAVASIGQVHRATLHSGEKVVVKVQCPRVAEGLETDLSNVGYLDSLFSLILPDRLGKTIVSELRDRFLEECDYQLEARNQTEFRELFAGRAGFYIPKVYEELSSRRILTTELVEGLRFDEFLKTASQERKNRAGELIWQFSFESIFKHRIFNCDPHPGNYLFRDDEVVFLDFGCCKRFDQEFVSIWKAFMRSVLEGDFEQSKKGVLAMGMAKDPEDFDFASFVKVTEALYAPWFHDKPVPFDPEYVKTTWDMSMTKKNPNRYKITYGKDWVFLNRLQWGMCAVLARLNASANWRQKILELLYKEGENRPTTAR